MTDATGFLKYARQPNPMRPEKDRTADFADLHTCLSDQHRTCQASRCMDCGVPFCQSHYGCPLHNLIPEWNALLSQGNIRAAFDRLIKTAPFPEFTGYVCPALCEKACNLSENAVTNRDNERYLIEEGFRNGWVVPRMPEKHTGKTVAIVGSGPAGLAAADFLGRLGHSVTVYEQDDRPGGLLMYGIPNMKLPKAIVARRIALMEQSGVVFRTGVRADASLMDAYDAVILCGGSRKPRALNVPGQDASGVHYAVAYLTAATRAVLAEADPSVTARGKHVIVVGGGDTGNDCVGTAIRQGCASVLQLEMMPAAPLVRPQNNPWPEWPRVLRTDYGQEEAIALQSGDPRRFSTTVQRVLTDASGQVTAVEIAKVDENLRRIPGTDEVLPCELLLIATGFVGVEDRMASDFSLTLTKRGVPDTMTHFIRDNLFAAGDFHTGQSLVVRAIADGRAAAAEADSFLQNK